MDKKQRIQELKNKINELKKLENQYQAMQMALKLVLNGSYGAFANEFFVCSSKEIAAAITAMGRDLIQYMDKCNQYYWYNIWHTDIDLLKFLNCYRKNYDILNAFKMTEITRLGKDEFKVKYKKYKTLDFFKDLNIDYTEYEPLKVNKIDNEWIHTRSRNIINESDYENKSKFMEDYIEGVINRKVPVSIYADTDSLFISMKPGMESCKWDLEETEFIHRIYEFRLSNFFNEKLDAYAKKYGVDNLQDFELERINESILFLGKKMYIQHVRWEDGVEYNKLEYLYSKGVQMIKSSTPPFAREKIYDIVKYLLANPKDYSLKNILKLVKNIKKEFELANIDDISMTISCSNYKKNVIDDINEMKFQPDTFWAIKTAAHHNYLMNQKTEWKDKYEAIKDGSKIKYYYCKSDLYKTFGYLRGSHPFEFAPEVDYDLQFEKTVLTQVNDYIEALGLPDLSKKLRVVLPLF